MHAKSTTKFIEESSDKDFVRSKPMSLYTLEQFCQRMGVGLRAGVDLLRLLEVEKKQGSSHHRQVNEEVILKIRKGNSLAQALKSIGGYYPHMLVQMISAGESGGGLDRIFTYMSGYYHDLRTARNDFLQRIAWPIIQLVMALMVISLVIVIRGFMSPPSSNPNDLQFDSSGLGLSGFGGLAIFWSVILSFLGILFLVAFGVWKNWFGAHRILLPLIRNVPVIGTVFTTTAISRLSMTLSMLLNAGVDARRCLREAFKSTGNHYYIAGLPLAEATLAKGASFASAFEASKVLPNDFVRAIEVGELSGTETDSLDRLAIDYNQRAKSAMTQLAVASSVAIWVMISLFLIFMIIRMFMSYVDLLNNAGKM